ncbi:DUF4870 domain-containing protein [Clostridium sp. D2Q-14]|uniref:DUF4870 domain-containing protein n=1 Tax=Anaeromonas gelatinilytica TaxID=2683194 RepID=UPI00193B06A0|nr:DUF4870 domain-containing protein [Anaeromonas gelatinilytica]
MLTNEQKILSIICHLGIFIGMPIIIPLIILLFAKDGFIKTQAMEALGFHIMILVLGAIAGILVLILIGIPLLILIAIVTFIFPIIATINIANNNDYSYPISGRYIRKSI